MTYMLLYIINHMIDLPLHRENSKWYAGGPKHGQRRVESIGEAWDSLELDLNVMEAKKYV